MDMKLELVMVPVTDIDRAKEFYVGRGSSATTTRRSARRSGSCS